MELMISLLGVAAAESMSVDQDTGVIRVPEVLPSAVVRKMSVPPHVDREMMNVEEELRN